MTQSYLVVATAATAPPLPANTPDPLDVLAPNATVPLTLIAGRAAKLVYPNAPPETATVVTAVLVPEKTPVPPAVRVPRNATAVPAELIDGASRMLNWPPVSAIRVNGMYVVCAAGGRSVPRRKREPDRQNRDAHVSLGAVDRHKHPDILRIAGDHKSSEFCRGPFPVVSSRV